MPPPDMPMRAKGGRVFEGSKKDEAQDRRLAKKHGMALSQWEKSPLDAKHDRQGSEKGLKSGGTARASGGGVKAVGMKVGTPVEHDKAKTDTDDMKRPGMKMKPKVVTFATGGGVVSFKTGGRIEAPVKGGMGPKLPGGVAAGETRLAQAARAKRNYHGPLK